ncbi:MAG: hypothetical protein ABIJ09_08895 [Pseudomonadota bacterium]
MSMPATWKNAMESLEPDKQQAVKAWLDTQMFIARELGLEAEEWFEYVEWAFKNPFDFGFAADGGLVQIHADGMLNAAVRDSAAKAVGGVTRTKLPGGGGPGNLLNMVVQGKKSRDK